VYDELGDEAVKITLIRESAKAYRQWRSTWEHTWSWPDVGRPGQKGLTSTWRLFGMSFAPLENGHTVRDFGFGQSNVRVGVDVTPTWQ